MPLPIARESRVPEDRPRLVHATTATVADGDERQLAHHHREGIANGLIYNGVPSKLIDCLASGGFALSDPKVDLVRLFGRDVEAIFFRNADELNAKIEYFLPRRDERREIVHELRKTIERECTLERLFERVLASHAAGTAIRSG
jgi:spore maturation protein CgeB